MTEEQPDRNDNLGTRRVAKLVEPRFPSADVIVGQRAAARRLASKVDVLLVNPPSPDGAIWIRSQHRVGRRSRENMIWPQVSLAQLAALLVPDFTVEVVDAIATRMTWKAFEALLKDRRPRYYLTHVTAPTLTNDMYGVFLAKSLEAVTIGFGTHVTPMAGETLRTFPALDFVLRGEPELTLRELVDTFEAARITTKVVTTKEDVELRGDELNRQGITTKVVTTKEDVELHGDEFIRQGITTKVVTTKEDVELHGDEFIRQGITTKVVTTKGDEFIRQGITTKVVTTKDVPSDEQLTAIKGLGWRRAGVITINADRPFIQDLDDLPLPLHHLLPLDKYRAPMIKGPYTFIVSSRGCPAGCKYCIKHVSYQHTVRLRSAEKLFEEVKLLAGLGVHHVQFYADLFTVNREQVMALCRLLIESKLGTTWTCNSRVDFVDEEMLGMMARAGCTLIAWGIESGSEAVLKRAHKGYKMEQAGRALAWSKKAGIQNWGYFIVGLPGETEETIRATMALSKELPLDMALFHVAAPYPGTPFFFEVVENGWFRPETDWEAVDMDQGTVLDYPELKAEELLGWQRRAFREWAMRPGPVLTYLKSMNTWEGFKSALNAGWQTLRWVMKR